MSPEELERRREAKRSAELHWEKLRRRAARAEIRLVARKRAQRRRAMVKHVFLWHVLPWAAVFAAVILVLRAIK